MIRSLLTLLCLFSVFALAEEGAQPASSVVAVIVSANQDINALKLSPDKLKLIYLRKQLYWPNGKRVLPVNLQTEHPLRSLFSKTVLGSLPAEQIDYWNGMYFNGIRPPHVLNSDEAMVRYVSQTAGAIGYVDACRVDERVQAVLWLDGSKLLAQAPDGLRCSN